MGHGELDAPLPDLNKLSDADRAILLHASTACSPTPAQATFDNTSRRSGILPGFVH
jgi:hypothetical protein